MKPEKAIAKVTKDYKTEVQRILAESPSLQELIQEMYDLHYTEMVSGTDLFDLNAIEVTRRLVTQASKFVGDRDDHIDVIHLAEGWVTANIVQSGSEELALGVAWIHGADAAVAKIREELSRIFAPSQVTPAT